jgi:hypothetical protein
MYCTSVLCYVHSNYHVLKVIGDRVGWGGVMMAGWADLGLLDALFTLWYYLSALPPWEIGRQCPYLYGSILYYIIFYEYATTELLGNF